MWWRPNGINALSINPYRNVPILPALLTPSAIKAIPSWTKGQANAKIAPTTAIASETTIGTNLVPEKNPITGGNWMS